MAGLTVQNFVSAATGIAIAMALTRATLYVLPPLSILIALVFAAMGLPQALDASVSLATPEGSQQVIAVGPVASQEAIKQLGTNGQPAGYAPHAKTSRT